MTDQAVPSMLNFFQSAKCDVLFFVNIIILWTTPPSSPQPLWLPRTYFFCNNFYCKYGIVPDFQFKLEKLPLKYFFSIGRIMPQIKKMFPSRRNIGVSRKINPQRNIYGNWIKLYANLHPARLMVRPTVWRSFLLAIKDSLQSWSSDVLLVKLKKTSY